MIIILYPHPFGILVLYHPDPLSSSFFIFVLWPRSRQSTKKSLQCAGDLSQPWSGREFVALVCHISVSCSNDATPTTLRMAKTLYCQHKATNFAPRFRFGLTLSIYHTPPATLQQITEHMRGCLGLDRLLWLRRTTLRSRETMLFRALGNDCL